MNASSDPMSQSGGASGYLTIDLAALRYNYTALSARAGAATLSSVVKADAYGLGAEIVAPEFYNAGCRLFFVAMFDEAIKLRPKLPDDALIFVLNGLQPGSEQLCAELNINPVINSLEQMKNWVALCNRMGRKLEAAVQIDSGMSRLGLSAKELSLLQEDRRLLDGFKLAFVMSHLACADEVDHPQNRAQLENFAASQALFAGAVQCFSNSGGLFLGNDYHHQIIRPGIALYGDAPSLEVPSPVRPVISLDVSVIQTRSVTKGTAIGYGAAFIAERDMRLATLAAGYADGLPRCLTGIGAAWHKGKRLPFVGRVSMDSIIIDISELEENELELGSRVEIIGENQSLRDVADAAGTISYEILTSLGQRYRRQYINASQSNLQTTSASE